MSKIYVTKPYLPPYEDFEFYVRQIWENSILTNNGPLHVMLENKLKDYLGVEYISLFTNGTIALITAIQSLKLTGEVITTPYTFAATGHSLIWNKLTPIFVDVNRDDFNIDPDCVLRAITPSTSAILAVHCYGNPCDFERLQRIADDYNLKIIYDAAHMFGVKNNGSTLLNNGDFSVLSFHATKVFNTFEGGAVVSRNLKMKELIDRYKNFGFVDETTLTVPGLNGKMSEVCAAMGLAQLKYVDDLIFKRKVIYEYYLNSLKSVTGISIPRLTSSEPNYSYFPILITDSFRCSRDVLYEELKEAGVNARRYFYPLLTDWSVYRGNVSLFDSLTNARLLSQMVLCLPIYPGLKQLEIEKICSVLKAGQ